MKLKVIGETSIKRELYFAAAHSLHDITLEFLPPDADRAELRRSVDSESAADYIVLAVGEDMAEGITGSRTPIVVPRIHNCAQLILGSSERFRKIFSENDDSPCWLDCYGEKLHNSHGTLCYIGGKLPRPELPESAREYIADFVFLFALLDGKWDREDIFILKSGERIIKDAVEILDSEAF